MNRLKLPKIKLIYLLWMTVRLMKKKYLIIFRILKFKIIKLKENLGSQKAIAVVLNI